MSTLFLQSSIFPLGPRVYLLPAVLWNVTQKFSTQNGRQRRGKLRDKHQPRRRKSNAPHLIQVKLHQYMVIPVRSSALFLNAVSSCCSVFTEQYSRPFNKRTLNRLAFFIQCKAYSAKQKKSDRYLCSRRLSFAMATHVTNKL